MGKAGNIDTSNKILTDSYSSRGQRYVPMPNPNKAKATPKLRKGEVILGQVLEKLTDEIFKIKLPNGVFKALVHPKLKQGDRLYFLIKEISPSIVISVHSTDLIFQSGGVSIDEIIRVLDLDNTETIRDIVIEYSKRVRRLFRHAIMDMSERADEYKNRKKQYNLTHNVEFILTDLYLNGYNLQDKNILNFVYNYISPLSIRLEENSIMPDMRNIDNLSDFQSPFVEALFVRNLTAHLNDAQSVYYISINGKKYRVELFRKHKILQAIISDEKNIDIKIIANLRDKNIKILYNKLDINIRKITKIADFNISYEKSNMIFINSFSENLNSQNSSITYVV